MRSSTDHAWQFRPLVAGKQATTGADDLCEIRCSERAILVAVWRLNPERQRRAPMPDLARELNALTRSAMRTFDCEERLLRLLKPSEWSDQRAAHGRILQDLGALKVLLLERGPEIGLDFDRVLSEYVIHCVCNDPCRHGVSNHRRTW